MLNVPLTTQVSRQAIVLDPAKAAADALGSLKHLSDTRAMWFNREDIKAAPVQKGVAKLGWSWEAMDVNAWSSKRELQAALVSLAEQPGSLIEHVFVQEWVNFDVEMRHFVVEPRLEDPQSIKAKKIVYTVFKTQEEGSFRNFDRYDRKGCLGACFANDDAALADAEQKAEELIGRWLRWLQGISHELPVVTRFDILAKRVGPGKAQVTTGELTELGGCFLGWPQGPKTVFSAMLRSCFPGSNLPKSTPT
jgi:hypothetical protein